MLARANTVRVVAAKTKATKAVRFRVWFWRVEELCRRPPPLFRASGLQSSKRARARARTRVLAAPAAAAPRDWTGSPRRDGADAHLSPPKKGARVDNQISFFVRVRPLPPAQPHLPPPPSPPRVSPRTQSAPAPPADPAISRPRAILLEGSDGGARGGGAESAPPPTWRRLRRSHATTATPATATHTTTKSIPTQTPGHPPKTKKTLYRPPRRRPPRAAARPSTAPTAALCSAPAPTPRPT
jgi:hypothetical protein